jgi:hypothetical protein
VLCIGYQEESTPMSGIDEVLFFFPLLPFQALVCRVLTRLVCISVKYRAGYMFCESRELVTWDTRGVIEKSFFSSTNHFASSLRPILWCHGCHVCPRVHCLWCRIRYRQVRSRYFHNGCGEARVGHACYHPCHLCRSRCHLRTHYCCHYLDYAIAGNNCASKLVLNFVVLKWCCFPGRTQDCVPN